MEKCPNCAEKLDSRFSYCPSCGQTTDLPRFRIRHILDEFFQAIFSVDKGVLFLVKNLATQPGYTAREYILEKKRKKYFNPFSFLLLVLGLSLSVNVLVKPYTVRPEKRATTSVTRVVPKDRLPYVARQRKASLFIEENINIVGLAAIPVFALVYWLCFRRSGINFAEHLVAQVFFASFFSLASIVITLVLGLVLKPYLPFLNLSLLGFQLIYLSIAYYQFLGFSRPGHYVRTVGATLLALGSWVLLSGGLVFLYVRYGS